jgi:hypothetical protein
MSSFLSALLIALAVLPAARADEVKMKDGKEYKNLRLLKETPTHLYFEDLDGKKVTLAKEAVEKHEKKPTIRDEVHDRVKKAGPDAKALLEIAIWAKAQGLAKDHREVLELVIKADPEQLEARAALDYVKYEGAWVLKKDLETKNAAAKAEQLKGLGYKLEKGKLVSPADASRNAAKLVQAGDYWVTAEQKKAIETKGLEFREGDWITKDEIAKFDAGQRKVGAAWKPILEADEVHRDLKDPWVLKGRYVEVRSNVRYSKLILAYQAANDAVNAAVDLSGVEPDVYGKLELLLVSVEKDMDSYKAQGARAQPDWSAFRSSQDGVFFSPKMGKDRGMAVTYFHDENHIRWWAGRGAFEAYAGRLTDVTRLDPVLLDTFAAYFASFVGDKYSPSAVQNYLFDKTKAMRSASKMFDGYDRKDAYIVPQSGFLIYYLVKKNREGTTRALQKFLAGNLRASDLVEAALGKVDPAELDKDYNEVWTKFRDNFRP